ncbi:MAG: exo-alpha-sialidase [Sphingobacteriaceae bacterium]|nr:exo-alpha-sialidase [Sphingobacteriaceae bacterium]
MGIFAGTTNGIFLTFDSGDTWGPSGLSSEYVSSLAVNGGTVFAGTMGNGLFVSINDGATWVPVTNAPTGSYIYQVVLSGSNMIVSCINGNLISTDNGLSWTSVSALPTQANFVSSGNFVVARNYGGGVYLSSDNGLNWSSISMGIPPNVNAYALCASPTCAYLAADDNKLYKKFF